MIVVNIATKRYFFMSKDTFSCLKNKQKIGYMEMVEKFYLET